MCWFLGSFCAAVGGRVSARADDGLSVRRGRTDGHEQLLHVQGRLRGRVHVDDALLTRVFVGLLRRVIPRRVSAQAPRQRGGRRGRTSASTLRLLSRSALLPANAITTLVSPRLCSSFTHDLAPSNESCHANHGERQFGGGARPPRSQHALHLSRRTPRWPRPRRGSTWAPSYGTALSMMTRVSEPVRDRHRFLAARTLPGCVPDLKLDSSVFKIDRLRQESR